MKLDLPENYAFIDGSYNNKRKICGYGGFLVTGTKKHVIQGSLEADPEITSMRNVSGEIFGSMVAIGKAVELGVSEVTIYYDYLGVEHWATGKWKQNKKWTRYYHNYIQEMKKSIKINFVWVKGHSGIDGNEEADILAKKASGVL